MKLTLREFRQLLYFELLGEALDVGAMANRGLGNRGIVVADAQGGEYLVAVSTKDSASYPIAYDATLPKVLGSAAGKQEAGGWRLHTLYADDPVTAIMLLGAALERWKKVLPDASVSPAAQAVMKRYFDTYKDDPSRIELNADPDRPSHGKSIWQPDGDDFLKAAYLGPVGFNLAKASSSGDQAIDAAVDPATPPVKEAGRVRAWLQIVAKKGFEAAYDDVKRTKMS
jgi:hypothetical protein